MTDNEIIKALECYRGPKLFAFNGKKPEIYIHDIIDIITRQKAEIDEHSTTIEGLKDAVGMYEKEIERLQNNISAMATTLSNSARATRHEAIKEFADRLQRRCIRQEGCLWSSDIGAEMNEMVGDV